MIVYQATKTQFLKHAFEEDIHEVIGAAYKARTGRRVSPSEFASWKESLICMAKVLKDEGIPEDSGIAIEYGIPGSAKRVDFIVSGLCDSSMPSVVVVELKRWDKARRTDRDAIVRTRLSGAEQEVTHPSYQAWSYAALLTGFNEAVYEGGMRLSPCAYLHNYTSDGEIDHGFYRHYIEKAPLFLKGEAERNKLRDFIKRFVRHGDKSGLIYQIENSRIRPSKSLVDSIDKMMKGNQEFVLVDDQKIVFERALALATNASLAKKRVMIIEGGPGTGKSLVAVNLLIAMTRLRRLARYVSKNAAPRSVYESKLTGVMRKTEISNLFSGSGVFTVGKENEFDLLIIDEAHRLNEKSGLYQNLGDNQIKELISAAKCAVFFVDEAQRVTLKDIGSKAEIARWATELGASVVHAKLESQFRCNGSDGYLSWLDNVLEVRPAANPDFDAADFDFRVVDTPNELRNLIRKANTSANKARMVAGYCWNWTSKKNPHEFDIVMPKQDFSIRWNLSRDGSLWIIAPESVEEIGCIHTSQGLEVDYIGVIIGPDLVVRDGRVETHPERRARTDQSLKGIKKWSKVEPGAAAKAADEIIKNTYRTLMTRGMKGCYVYCTDPETAAYFRARIAGTVNPLEPREPATVYELPFQRVTRNGAKPYVNAVPLVDLKFAAGSFSHSQFVSPDHDDWAILPAGFRPRKGMFVAQVVGESMNKRFPNGSWCLFELNPKGSRNGRVVVAEHRSIEDPETGGSYTIKVYQSKKVSLPGGSWRHLEIRLKPDSDDPQFKEIVFGPDAAGSVRIVAEMIRDL